MVSMIQIMNEVKALRDAQQGQQAQEALQAN
jgi:hypothetical protein